jgi:hypothetical protein
VLHKGWDVCVRLGAEGSGLQGLSEAARLEGAFGGSFNSASGWREGRGWGGQRKLWAPPAGEDLEQLQSIVFSGQAFGAGRGGLRLPSPSPHIWWASPTAAGRSSCGLLRESLVTSLWGWGCPFPKAVEP